MTAAGASERSKWPGYTRAVSIPGRPGHTPKPPVTLRPVDTPGPEVTRAQAVATEGGVREVGPRTLSRRFLLTYGLLLALATLAIGLWTGRQIEEGVLNRTAAITSLYLHSVVAPQVQSLAVDPHLSGEAHAALGRILADTDLGRQIVSFRIWSRTGEVLYSPLPAMQGRTFPVEGDLARSLAGAITADFTTLEDQENLFERQQYERLVEIYAPILQDTSGAVLAVAEFYALPDEIDGEVANARVRSWAVLILASIASFLVVAWMVLRTTRTITRQQSRLHDQVSQLSVLLAQVGELNADIREAGSRAVALNARERRRISADLHDGPGQAMALALLGFEELEEELTATASPGSGRSRRLTVAHGAISDALHDLRQIAAGLRMPELAPLSVTEVIERAVDTHHGRTGMQVELSLDDLPTDATLAVKIGLFRALEETLSNATRHGRGIGVGVRAWSQDGDLHLVVSDGGPGFGAARQTASEGLGLPGIRERTALVGGTFQIESQPGRGTRVRLSWPLLGGDDILDEPLSDRSAP